MQEAVSGRESFPSLQRGSLAARAFLAAGGRRLHPERASPARRAASMRLVPKTLNPNRLMEKPQEDPIERTLTDSWTALFKNVKAREDKSDFRV